MPTKPLEIRLLELQLKRAKREAEDLERDHSNREHKLPWNHLNRIRENRGPEFMEVRSSDWGNVIDTDYGRVQSFEEARVIAKQKGFLGIRITHK